MKNNPTNNKKTNKQRLLFLKQTSRSARRFPWNLRNTTSNNFPIFEKNSILTKIKNSIFFAQKNLQIWSSGFATKIYTYKQINIYELRDFDDYLTVAAGTMFIHSTCRTTAGIFRRRIFSSIISRLAIIIIILILDNIIIYVIFILDVMISSSP